MSKDTNNKIKAFRQVPVWKEDDKIVMSGEHFTALRNFFDIFVPTITAMEEIFAYNINSGTIKIEYEDEKSGKKISREEAMKRLEQLQQSKNIQTEEKKEES